MLDKECLKYNLFQYFELSKNKFLRGLVLITNKQYLLYSQVKSDYKNHNEIAISLENLIHPYYKIYSIDAIRSNHVLVSSLGQELFIELPINGEFSLSQYLFLKKMLKDISLINLRNARKIGIVIINSCVVYENDNPDVDLALSLLKSLITKDITYEEEKIIGKTLKSDSVIKVMKYYIDLDNCVYLNDLFNSFKMCDIYYLDRYYNRYIKKLFPSYYKAKKLFAKIKMISDENFVLNNITYHNIEYKLQSLYNSLVKVKKR